MFVRKLGIYVIGALFMAFGVDLFAASFDCQKARTNVEKMICSNEQLSQLDSDLLISYRKAKANNPSVVEEQRAWIKGNSSCTDIPCLVNRYTTRIAQLNDIKPSGRDQTIQPTLPASNEISLDRLFQTNGSWVSDDSIKISGQQCSTLLANSDFALAFENYQPELLFIKIRSGGKHPYKNDPKIVKNLNSDIRVPIKLSKVSSVGDLIRFHRLSTAPNGATIGENFELDLKRKSLRSLGQDTCQRCDSSQMANYEMKKTGSTNTKYWCLNN